MAPSTSTTRLNTLLLTLLTLTATTTAHPTSHTPTNPTIHTLARRYCDPSFSNDCTGPSQGAIIGIVLGAFAGLVFVFVLIMACARANRASSAPASLGAYNPGGAATARVKTHAGWVGDDADAPPPPYEAPDAGVPVPLGPMSTDGAVGVPVSSDGGAVAGAATGTTGAGAGAGAV